MSTLRSISHALALASCLGWAALALGGTISVTTNVDEDNNFTTGPNAGRTKGCSLREALQSIANGANYNDCTGFSGTTNTINLAGAGGTIVINSAVPAPGAPSGTVRNGLLPFVTSAMGTVIISGGTVSCDTGVNGSRIFTENSGASLTLTGMSISNCTAGGAGIAVQNNGGDLTLNTVTFNSVNSNSGGTGGAVYHAGGTLNINAGAFTSCGTTDGGSPANGDGGAIYISGVTGSAPATPGIVNITGVAFTSNTAAGSGGAIYVSQANDSFGHYFTIKGATFTTNKASGSGAEKGGGAIWAATDAFYDLTHMDLFLIVNTFFTGNLAQGGEGGAILLAGGQLSSIDPLVPQPAALAPLSPVPQPTLGGIVASDFTGNLAMGSATSDALGGSGGALYIRGNLSIEQSSFELNKSMNGSGGAILLRNPSSTNFVNIANVTFNLNTADQAGGAIANVHGNGKATLVNDTLDGNTAAGNTGAGNTIKDGGAIYNANTTLADFSVTNSLVGNSGTSPAVNCAGQPVTDGGNNLQYSPDAGCGGMAVGDPLLGALGIPGGGLNLLVNVMPLGGGSPALAGGNVAVCAAQPIFATDATGTPNVRPNPGGSKCDIGAYESSSFPVELMSFSVE